eukprot:1180605-Prorocentrum_minimum.AAC.3
MGAGCSRSSTHEAAVANSQKGSTATLCQEEGPSVLKNSSASLGDVQISNGSQGSSITPNPIPNTLTRLVSDKDQETGRDPYADMSASYNQYPLAAPPNPGEHFLLQGTI